MVAGEKLDVLAGIAVAQAMFTYTFGIVTDSQGLEGKGLGTGVGAIWRGKYVIATAKHVIEGTPPERIYYFLPQDSLQIEESSSSIDWARCKWSMRYSLESPRILSGTTDDLAVIVLPEQLQDAGKKHFYVLDEVHATPSVNTVVGYLGYPSARTQPFGENYAVTPCHAFGQIRTPTCDYDLNREFAITYTPGSELDPRGFSGSGAWQPCSEGMIWSPRIRLAGIVTNYYRNSQVLICCRIERLASFLAQNEANMSF